MSGRRSGLLACAGLLLALAAGAAPLGDNTVRLAPSQLKLPQNIGPLRYNSQRTFSDRRMGRAYLYNASGISLSIYVYDHGLADLPEGPDSVPLCEQYESAKREIESGGNYENVRLQREYSRRMAEAGGSPWLREAQYEFERNGVHAVSVLWLGSIDGFFFKLRLSLRTEVAEELEEARPSILAAFAQAVAVRRRGASSTSAPDLPEASVEVDGHHDADTAAVWWTYAAELLRYSREHPGSRPVCGGLLAPDHDAEFAARAVALSAYRARAQDAAPLPYWDELARVERAGFFDEYLWHYFSGPRDIAPPNLDLAGFEEFRVRELARHVPQSGARVRIHTVRKLPAAPDAN